MRKLLEKVLSFVCLFRETWFERMQKDLRQERKERGTILPDIPKEKENKNKCLKMFQI